MIARPGQTLIEVLLALAIILVGMMSLVSTLINAKITADASVDSAIAVQLAREPVEAARFIRDSNWLERENGYGTTFNDRLSNGSDHTAVYVWDPAQTNLDNAVQFDFTPNSNSDPMTVIYQNSDGLYLNTITGSATIYSRYVTLFPICSSDGGVTETILTADGQTCAVGVDEIGIQVTSTVTWSSRGTEHTVALEEQLYNWRYAQP